jgi:hypothetical protein
MVGLFNATTAFRNILWSDAELLSIAIDYANLSLTIRESTGQLRRVICEGYIGYQTLGFWDEIVISKAELESEGKFLECCVKSLDGRLGTNRPESGSEARNRQASLQLTITFSDECRLFVAMKGLRTEIVEKI